MRVGRRNRKSYKYTKYKPMVQSLLKNAGLKKSIATEIGIEVITVQISKGNIHTEVITIVKIVKALTLTRIIARKTELKKTKAEIILTPR